MNFFEYQDQARRRTRWLLVVFILAVLAIVVAVDAALLVAFGIGAGGSLAASPDFWNSLASNRALLLGGSVVTVLVIVGASLYRMATLSRGGGAVARSLGGVPVEADSQDPLRTRLRNVVEEMALASGVPVPEIYVLEQEEGINAFAAGFTPSDAAVAVTRGALEQLDRAELQGVIAHEFSHILNGDMRLNIRLMGVLFGILVLALAGRRVLTGMRFSRGSGRKGSGGAVALVALALMAVGYVGLFLGRWIKAGVSRQREYLADASAVQFTRHPEGVAGALKKIALHRPGAVLEADTEEVAHMLFGQGFASRLFATHPPLIERIRRIEPRFNPAELERMRRQRDAAARAREEAPAAATRSGAPARDTPGFDVERLIRDIGRPGWDQIVAAAALAASLPGDLVTAARSAEWAPEALLRVLLDERPGIRDRQLLAVARHLGADSERQVRFLEQATPQISVRQRLPLLEIAFPALKRRPRALIERFLACVEEVVRADDRIDTFEYLLGSVVRLHLRDALVPAAAAPRGRLTIGEATPDVAVVLSIIATHGHDDAGAAEAAFRQGMKMAGLREPEPFRRQTEWADALDGALTRLDHLVPADKERVLRAMVGTVLADGAVVARELELLRAAAAAIHLPVPLIQGISGG